MAENSIKIKMTDKNSYVSLENEMEQAARSLKEMLLVLEKFPDAEMAYSDHAPEHCPGIFSAASIVKENDLKIRFWSDWYSLHVDFYAEILFESKLIEIHGKPVDLDVWQIPHGILVIDDPHTTWNHIDKILPALGYDEKYLKIIYNKVLELMAKPVKGGFTNNLISIRITNKEEMPSYILNKLPFI